MGNVTSREQDARGTPPTSPSKNRSNSISCKSNPKDSDYSFRSDYSPSPTPPSSLTDAVKRVEISRVEDKFAIKNANILAQLSQLETVPTAFKWSDGGTHVFVTGSFNNWQGKIKMHRNNDITNEFVLIIEIPPGIHQYKFIVDGEWRLNRNAPTVRDNMIENNVVTVQLPIFDQTYGEPYEDSDGEFENDQAQGGYGQEIPSIEQYSNLPPKLPPHLLSDYLPINAPTNKDDPHVLPIPSHVALNHFYMGGASNEKTTEEFPNGTNQSMRIRKQNIDYELDDNVLVTAITERFRTKRHISITPKFVTLIYYRPKPHPKDSPIDSPSSPTMGKPPKPVQYFIK